MDVTIRTVRRGELGQVYDLLAAAFPEARRELFVSQTEDDSTFRLRHGRVAVDNERFVGYVRIFARTMMVRGRPVPVGGIGSVATERAFESQGIATALLQDAIAQMRREGMQASFLFTGIPGFYERMGYRVVREPQFELEASACAGISHAGLWVVRAMRDEDTRRLRAIYRRAIVGSTGAVVRTLGTWRDARSWLDEDAGGCFVAERNGAVVGYLRSRRRAYGRQILEAECAPGHDGAIAALVSAVGRRAREHGERIVALAPDGHPLATALRSAGASETTDVPHPMMVLGLGLGDAWVQDALLSDPIRFWNTDRI
ncbi:MAG: GNAT family N-acetyltransferase [Chloroflexi bacterium]|nr:GNAT family N-acetyltransferase [Chloroflexota bacterium]